LADLYRHVYIDCGNEVKDIPSSNPSRRDFLQSIANFLKSEFGVEMMIDGAATQKISLLESAHEFCHRYRQQQLQKERQVVSAVSNCETTSIALSSTQTRYIKKKTTANGSMVLSSSNSDDDTTMDVTVVDHPPGLVLESDDDCKSAPVQNEQNSNRVHTHNQTTALPVLASSCPGFVCLVEKTAAPVVPLLSSSKSPMSVAGTLLKSGILTRGDNSSTNHIIGERQLFHVAVMPCHDKKLEAGRNDFSWERQTLLKYTSAINGKSETTYNGNNNSKDVVYEVDLVLTTGELLEILTTAAEKPVADASSNSKSGRSIQDLLISLQSAADSTTSQPPCLLLTDLDLCEQGVLDNSVSEGEKSSTLLEVDLGVHGSGSYADFIFRYAAKDLFGCELPPNKPLPWKGASSSSAKCSAEVQSSRVIRRRPRRQDTTDLRSITLYKHSDGLYSCNKTESGCDKPVPVLNFATAYGFKNVQLILQSLSKEGYTAGALDAKGYDYVEVMACPSGCPNGGGQIGAMGQRETPKETKERVKRTVSLIPVLRPHNEKRSFASSLYGLHDDAIDDASHLDKFKLEDGCFGKIARRLLHTRFHVVPKLELSTGATAGVAISDTKW
jgi:iron only hydrogenase large subunit-like protein